MQRAVPADIWPKFELLNIALTKHNSAEFIAQDVWLHEGLTLEHSGARVLQRATPKDQTHWYWEHKLGN